MSRVAPSAEPMKMTLIKVIESINRIKLPCSYQDEFVSNVSLSFEYFYMRLRDVYFHFHVLVLTLCV